MPKKKITPEVRKKMISELLRGNQTQASVAAAYDVHRRTLSEDRKKNAPLWKSEAVEILRRELTTSAEELLFAERHLKQGVEPDEAFRKYIDDALRSLSVLERRLKRVKKVFRTAK